MTETVGADKLTGHVAMTETVGADKLTGHVARTVRDCGC